MAGDDFSAGRRLTLWTLMPVPRQSSIAFTINGPVARADLVGLCNRVCALLERTRPREVYADVRAANADLVTVDALARLQLAARRRACQIRLRGMSDDLRELVALMGLQDVLPD
jgi:ABC-type transporter Mla MlaB component